MYDWLGNSVSDQTTLVTPNRRLARTLRDAYGQQQINAGASAWRTPAIFAWTDWLVRLFESASGAANLPARINAQQSRLLWESCLQAEVDDSTAARGTLVRLACDAWQRLAQAGVGIRELARSAQSDDQRMFASAAARYLAILERENWTDDALLPAAVLSLIEREVLKSSAEIVLVGFDRETPAMANLFAKLLDAGVRIRSQAAERRAEASASIRFDSADSELRAAGAWARDVLRSDSSARVAVVKAGLEASASRDARLLREGLAPGWQYGPRTMRDVVNVSYGQSLAEYPAARVALEVLRWLAGDLTSREVALVLRSDLVGQGECAARSRLELKLREMPDRAWSPAMITSALGSKDDNGDAKDWLRRVALLGHRRRQLPSTAPASDWALLFRETLQEFGWPGAETLDSRTFQLINRWYELLNEFARLDLVARPVGATTATRRLQQLASETVFQAETTAACIQLLGPLEAAGAEFDALWIAGMTSTEWPATGRPSPLLSRSLQRQYGMQDATPDDTLAWTEATLERLLNAAPLLVCSWPEVNEDGEQSASELLLRRDIDTCLTLTDPGWHVASLLCESGAMRATDSVPQVVEERIFGGAGTVARQMSEPFSAFVSGRLGANQLVRQASGIPASLRGRVMHDALYRIFSDVVDSGALRENTDEQLETRAGNAVAAAMARHERNTDAALLQLLHLERARLTRLILAFLRTENDRDVFRIRELEGTLEFRHGNIALQLRFDRVDEFSDGQLAIYDYKSGIARELFNRDGSVGEPQLFVYAMAAGSPVAALALINIDSREIAFSGAGRGYTDEEQWPELLASVETQVLDACKYLEAGDVRLLALQGALSARPLNLLSRYTELRYGD